MRQGFFLLFTFMFCHDEVMGITFTHKPNCDRMDPLSVFRLLTVRSRLHCVVICERDNVCQSVQYGEGICHLNDLQDCSSNQITNSILIYYQKDLCQNGGYMISSGCRCINGYVGNYCERLMIDCSEGFKSPHGYTTSKVYTIQPFASTNSFQVYCKMVSNGGRTLFQVHRSTSFYFNKTWLEYRDGFGALTSNHWLGLQKMHLIISSGICQMVVYMGLDNGTFYQHYFKDFQIENESNLYRLNFSVAAPHTISALGDSLTDSKGMPFSTYDNDNDNSVSNCANIRRSGWWFNDCGPCNPNGELLKPADSLKTSEHEVFWRNNLQDVVPFRVEMWLIS